MEGNAGRRRSNMYWSVVCVMFGVQLIDVICERSVYQYLYGVLGVYGLSV